MLCSIYTPSISKHLSFFFLSFLSFIRSFFLIKGEEEEEEGEEEKKKRRKKLIIMIFTCLLAYDMNARKTELNYLPFPLV